MSVWVRNDSGIGLHASVVGGLTRHLLHRTRAPPTLPPSFPLSIEASPRKLLLDQARVDFSPIARSLPSSHGAILRAIPFPWPIDAKEKRKRKGFVAAKQLTWTLCAGRSCRGSVRWRCCRSSTRSRNSSRLAARPCPGTPRKTTWLLHPEVPIARQACTSVVVSPYIRPTSHLKIQRSIIVLATSVSPNHR